MSASDKCPYCGAELDIGGQWYSCGLWPLTCEQRRTYTCLRNELKRLREQTVPREVADRLAALLIRYRDATPVNYDEVTYALADYRTATVS